MENGKYYKVKISNPCHENLNTMHSTAKGRFCTSCQKDVHDFTKLSDQEIANVLANAKGPLCGIFTKKQLQQSYKVPMAKPASFDFRRFFAGLVLPIGLTFTALSGYAMLPEKVKTEQFCSNRQISEPLLPSFRVINAENIVLHVTCQLSGNALAESYCVLIGTEKKWTADSTGTITVSLSEEEKKSFKGFEIHAPNYTSYLIQELPKENTQGKIEVAMASLDMMEGIAGGISYEEHQIQKSAFTKKEAKQLKKESKKAEKAARKANTNKVNKSQANSNS